MQIARRSAKAFTPFGKTGLIKQVEGSGPRSRYPVNLIFTLLCKIVLTMGRDANEAMRVAGYEEK